MLTVIPDALAYIMRGPFILLLPEDEFSKQGGLFKSHSCHLQFFNHSQVK
jgi:hypothetical protein